MRRQNDSKLKMWAREVRQHLAHDDKPVAHLVFHSLLDRGPASGHAENIQKVHLLELDEVEPDDIIRLGQFLLEEGVAEVTVKQEEVPAIRGA